MSKKYKDNKKQNSAETEFCFFGISTFLLLLRSLFSVYFFQILFA